MEIGAGGRAELLESEKEALIVDIHRLLPLHAGAVAGAGVQVVAKMMTSV